MARANDFEAKYEEQKRRGSRSRRNRIKAFKSHDKEIRQKRLHRRRSDRVESLGDEGAGRSLSDYSWRILDEALKNNLGKKAQKRALKVANRLKTPTVSGYTIESKPFGDVNLTVKFVWRKNVETDLMKGLERRELSLKTEKRRQRERIVELEKVKKRREDRAIEKAKHEEEIAILTRERERAEFREWENREEEFRFEQSKVRSATPRGRANPIDVFSKNLNLLNDFDIVDNEPYKIYDELTVKEMEELRADINKHLKLDRASPTHVVFWEAMMVVCEWEICEAQKRDVLEKAHARGEESPPEIVGLLPSLDAEMKQLLQGKSLYELEELQTQLEAEMHFGAALAPEFWRAVLNRLHVWTAKARLREILVDLLRQHLQRLQSSDEQEKHRSLGEERQEPADGNAEESRQDCAELLTERCPEELGKQAEDEPGSFEPVHGYDGGEVVDPEFCFSPELVQYYDGGEVVSPERFFFRELVPEDDGGEVVDPEADEPDLELKRAEVLEDHERRFGDAAGEPNVTEDGNLESTGSEPVLALKGGILLTLSIHMAD